MNLTVRMEQIIKMLSATDVLADIGCDHGKISLAVIEKNIAKKVIATDISSPSLEKTKQLIMKKNLNIECRLGDGFKPITKGEANAAVIAGMGGLLMIDIISQSYATAQAMDYIVLSPNTHAERLRKYLSNGFDILDEEVCFEDGHYYPIIKVKSGDGFNYTELEYNLGKIMIKKNTKVFKEYVKYKIREKTKVAKMLENAGKSAEKIETEINELREVLR